MTPHPLLTSAALFLMLLIASAVSAEPIRIGSRLELLVDDYLSNLADRPVRLKFALSDADLYSLRFR